MKRKLILSLTFFTSILLTSSILFGQNAEEVPNLKMFGIGMHIEQFKLTDITTNIATAPSNRIVFAITPTKNFRLEPEFGFSSFTEKGEIKLTNKSIVFGIGGFGMIQRGKTNIYGGLKFEFGKMSNEYYDIYSTYSVKTEKTDRFAIGPTIGAEFFLGNHFSFGGEVGIKYIKLKTKNEQYTGDDNDRELFTTDSGLLIRFYF